MRFVIKLSPEIIVKSAPVRRRFIRQLRRNLKTLLAPLADELSITGSWDRIEVSAQGDDRAQADVADMLARVPGIASYARVAVYPLGDFDAMADQAWNHYRDLLPGRSFVVRVKRSGQHPFSSPELERELGTRLLARAPGAWVSLREAQVRVSLEIVDARCYVIEQLSPGLGGFPLGQQPPVLTLISGGFDSTVATYLMLRRGLRTHFCFFNLGGRAHSLGVREVAHFLWQKYAASHSLTFVTVPFEGVVAEILERVDDSLMGVVLKRMMLRAATVVAEDLGADALVTGESVAQVSSQTLPNLAVIDRATQSLVLRPLIAMDKQDIIALARDIGTEPFAAHMPEYCGVISVRPSTHARLDRVERAEAAFDFAVLERALQARTEEDIAEVLNSGAGEIGVEIFRTPQPDVPILDIRHPEQRERRPLRAGGARIEAVPFFRLEQFFADLSRDAPYLLYCDQGLMSRLHAELLVEQGFRRVAVYRP